MTPNEKWMELYRPIWQESRTSRRNLHNSIGGFEEKFNDGSGEARDMIAALTGIMLTHHRNRIRKLRWERQRISDARKSGADPLLWKLSK